MDKRLMTVMMAAVLVALVITAIFYRVTVGARPQVAVTEKKLLVVAKNEMPIGAVITADDVRPIEFPVEAYPAGGFEAIEDVVDRSVVRAILPTEPITQAKVTDKGAGFGLAPLIPEGMRAVALAVNQVSGVSGFIIPGSKVDVLLAGRPNGSTEQVTATVLENVTVLSTGSQQEPDANGQPQTVPVINMLLDPDDAELVTLASSEGRIQLVLRNPRDEEETKEGREMKRASDLFKGLAPRRAAPAPGPRRAAPAPAPIAPPPPVIFQVEMIAGDQRSVEQVQRAKN